MKNDDEGTKMGTEMEPQNRKKRGLETDPNIISLSFGPPPVSGVGARPCRRKCRRSRSRKGGLSYVQERKGEDFFFACERTLIFEKRPVRNFDVSFSERP